MKLGRITLLNPALHITQEEKTALEDFIRAGMCSDDFGYFVMHFAEKQKYRHIDLRSVYSKITALEAEGFALFMQLACQMYSEEILAKELISLIKLKCHPIPCLS